MRIPDTKSLLALAQALVDTEDEELTCDEFLHQVAAYVERQQASGADPTLDIPAIEQHLKICPSCHEEFLILRKVLAGG